MNLNQLQLNKILKELDYLKSDVEYKTELIKEFDQKFISSVFEFLDTHPDLKKVYESKQTAKDNKVDEEHILAINFQRARLKEELKLQIAEINIRVRLLEEHEKTKRGLYSGAVGYISPSGDFDFNVVIRSILYNAKNKYLSFITGSAITEKAEAEKEYEECLVKAKAMREVLEN